MNILYICTHNRCRSIMCEAISRHIAPDDLQAFSAGSAPAGEIHPLTIQYLTERGIAVDGLTSQSWDDFADTQVDVVITVCDSAAGESCPLWMGDTLKLHWGLPDPSALNGNESDNRDAFFAVMETIEQRVRALAALAAQQLSPAAQQQALQQLIKE